MSYNIPSQLQGLNDNEVIASRTRYGYNRQEAAKTNTWLHLLTDILKEPMLILLMAIALIYLLTGNYGEAMFMLLALIAVSAISFYQDNRSKKALEALEAINEPLSMVIRNGIVLSIPTHELAVGDLCITEEGKTVNADGRIRYSTDFSVNEASLTGESFSIFKDAQSEDNKVYRGTVTISGLAVFEIEHIGKETRIGKIGSSIADIQTAPSPLQVQIRKFIKVMAIAGVAIFLLVCAVKYYQTQDLIGSLLNGLTLAMSILPEEIPVAFTTFMALGAWKLMREGIIVKRSSIIETLGSTTIICSDKTGTITENTMQLKYLYDYHTDDTYEEQDFNHEALSELISYSMWSSEPVPFDPMEQTIHRVYAQTQQKDQRNSYRLSHEYPLGGKPPMMTHIFTNEVQERFIASKGAPEAILEVSSLNALEKQKIRDLVADFGRQGYRVLGVAKSDFAGATFPGKQQDLPFTFLGLTVFQDPPKQGIQQVFKSIYDAGIKVKVITGDNEDTAAAILQQAGIINESSAINGTAIIAATDEQLTQYATRSTLFTRMFPEAKLAVVNALKRNGEVVAMLGDGVNDGPALKAANIGVAMGSKGTEIAKAAAALIIINDDLGKLITGIAAGRRIYANIKKAVRYIISIHIPIILTVSLPLFLGWIYPQIFTPVHVIFMELVMGPTCSIVYENEPMERNAMQSPPRAMSDTFLNLRELGISIVQGLVITTGVLVAYRWSVRNGRNEEETRAMVFTTLLLANILLSLVNRSFYYSIFNSFRNRNKWFIAINGLTIMLLLAILYIKPLAAFFKVTALSVQELGIAALIAGISVLWMELNKLVKRTLKQRINQA